MPKIANYIARRLKAKTVAVVWVNNDFGKGGRDVFIKEMKARGIKIVADVSTEAGQVDFAADVVKLKARERRRDLRLSSTRRRAPASCARRASRAITVPLIGETTCSARR